MSHRRILRPILGVLVLSLGMPPGANAIDLPPHIAEMAVLEGMFYTMTISRWDADADRLEFFWGDRYNVVRHTAFQDGRFSRLWKSHPLGGTIREIFVEDLEGDGTDEVVTYTSNGLIYIFEQSEDGYRLRWESVREDFESIQAMTVANVDADDAMELVLCADRHIIYYDSVELIREQEGREELNPVKLLVGNVDGDAEDELISSDGFVISTKTLVTEWAAGEVFGDPIYLYDFDGDGAFELIGQQLGAIKAWNLRDRRELW